MREPLDGRYVLVGKDPCEFAAVRRDRPDGLTDRWYPLMGTGSAPMTFDEVTAGPTVVEGVTPEQLPVVALYTGAQAVEDLVLPAAQVVLERYRQAMATERDERGVLVPSSRRAQFAQAAMAVEAFVRDLAAHHGVVAAPVAPVDGPTQVLARVPDVQVEDTQDVARVYEHLRQIQPQVPVNGRSVSSSWWSRIVPSSWRSMPVNGRSGAGRHRAARAEGPVSSG